MYYTEFHVGSPIGRKLAEQELDVLDQLAMTVQSYDPDDKKGFAAIVTGALHHGFTPAQLADAFYVSPATIGRWAAGKSVPGAHSRKAIVDEIRTMIATDAAQSRTRLERVG
ncbi:MAG: hypothetical protein GVY28_12125 [Alphaproteobacteria bacterium]|jgi:hypothetical protein|nr:hypothetical protein [Alphaproteobacteria bacterium]